MLSQRNPCRTAPEIVPSRASLYDKMLSAMLLKLDYCFECTREELLKECSGLKWVFHLLLFIEKQNTCLKVAQLEKWESQCSSRLAKGSTQLLGENFYALLSSTFFFKVECEESFW